MNGNPAPSDSKVQAISTMREICVQREWQPTPVFLPGESHGEKSLEGHNPRGFKELDMTEQVSMGALCFSEEERGACEGKDRPETTNTGEHPERRTRRRARTPGCGHMGMSRHRRAFLVGAPRGHLKVGKA